MSRLDDELRLAFSRQEPSPDFTGRVMEQINAQATMKKAAAKKAPTRRRWWESLLILIEPPRVRWLAAGLAALLLIAIGAFQYWPRHVASPEQQAASVEKDRAGERDGAIQAGDRESAGPKNQQTPDVSNQHQPGDDIAKGAESTELEDAKHPVKHRPRSVRKSARPDEPGINVAVKSEGEIAKEQLMLALHIASSTLGEAQKAVNGDDE